MFIDEVQIHITAGKGGDGLISWRREKYIPKGGPRGGDGGNGGNVFLQTNDNLNTLSEYRHKKVLGAQDGQKGGTQLMHGVNGDDLIIEVPVGTLVYDANTDELLFDLTEKNMKVLVAQGGRGGYGNAHFCSSTRQAPGFAEIGDIPEQRDLRLELKLVADIGIIGVPSAGKSTLISHLTNVKPKIGDYPFTTLTPNLGVLDHKGKSLVLEDVPGLIPGASQGKGLGIEFLKHIERTKVILHLLDLYRLDQVFEDYENIRYELGAFSEALIEKEEIIVFSKADLLDEEMREHIVEEFKKKYPKVEVLVISAASMIGIEDLKDFLVDSYTSEVQKVEDDNQEPVKMKIFDLKDDVDTQRINVTYEGNYIFKTQGKRIEQIVRMTDFDNMEAVMRVYNVMDKMGVIKEVEKKLAKVTSEEERDNSFFFEGGGDDNFNPKILIAGREIPLQALKYKL